jgi:hypothetical protein
MHASGQLPLERALDVAPHAQSASTKEDMGLVPPPAAAAVCVSGCRSATAACPSVPAAAAGVSALLATVATICFPT